MKIWEHDLAAATLPIAVMNWAKISGPPPVYHLQRCHSQVLQGTLVPIDKEDGDASSDDEDGVELEPAEELEDPGFLADLDCVFGDSD
jgi:hypothetical protein